MQIITKEHEFIMEHFEKEHFGNHEREPKHLWPMGQIYCDSEMNRDFLAYRKGYSLARSVSWFNRCHE